MSNLNKASFTFNRDESGFRSDPSRFQDFWENEKPLCRVSGRSVRGSTTVLVCISVDGSVMPPMTICLKVTPYMK